ncbi:MAG: N-acyl-D-amino-acid deacylase family protein [bacterium]
MDAKGLFVTPGFIDIHSHSDLNIREAPSMENMLRQGVSTQIVGNCGINLGIQEGSLSNFMEELERTGIGTNLAFLVGHGALRRRIMDLEDRPPTKDELKLMEFLLEEALGEGAIGLSTGLEYPPGIYAKTTELIELSKIVSKRDGIYATHLRNEGDKVEEAVREAIEIGEKTEVSVQISHHKAEKRKNWGKIEITLGMIDDAKSRGLDISCDVYPYTAYMTRLGTPLLPPWALNESLSEPDTYGKVLAELKRVAIDWDLIYIARCNLDKSMEGCNILELARKAGVPPEEFALQLLIKDERVGIISFQMSEDDVRKVIKYPHSFIGSDGSGYIRRSREERTHPRSFGTFPRVLGRYTRELQLLSWEEAISKMTFLPSKKTRLSDRGIIREGAYADIVIFDPEKIIDRATYEDPFQYPEGIEYLIINGQLVIIKGVYTGKRIGRILK